jgi:hypothetical protein
LRQALKLVHPDRQPKTAPLAQRFIAERLSEALNTAHRKFEDEQ